MKQLQDSISSVSDVVKDAFTKDNAESREVDQCGELFDSTQTLNLHKFQKPASLVFLLSI